MYPYTETETPLPILSPCVSVSISKHEGKSTLLQHGSIYDCGWIICILQKTG